MKPFTVASLSILLFAFAACKKSSSPPTNTPSNGSVTFTANGNAVVVSKITIDTSRSAGFMYPQIIINGVATIGATKDTLVMQFQIFNDNNTLSSVSQFTGNFTDTSRMHHFAEINLNSSMNYNAYSNVASNHDLYVSITSNDGKTVAGTFYGSLVVNPNNTGAPPYIPLTNGSFTISLPGK